MFQPKMLRGQLGEVELAAKAYNDPLMVSVVLGLDLELRPPCKLQNPLARRV